AQPRPAAGELAVLSTRTGSPEDLAAEIVETKRRLIERGASVPRHAEPLEEPAHLEADLDRPGFYRRPLPVRDGATLTVPRPVEPAYVPPVAARPEAPVIPIVVPHDVRPIEAHAHEADVVPVDLAEPVVTPIVAPVEPVAAAAVRPAIRMRIRPTTPPTA
ncbi:MAG: hypothetical protein IAI48_10240, partial [Candidatus Eremiobacteraeota bacterium]|nr:hypothetical protein [Candidatus Eremiobacteraeota bacterium]